MIKTLEKQRLDAFEDWLRQIHSTWNEAPDKKFSASTIHNYRSHVAALQNRSAEYELASDLYAEEDPKAVWQCYRNLLEIPTIATEQNRNGKDIQAGVEKYCDFLRYQKDFDWIPFFQELADKLRDYENRQSDLMNVLRMADVEVGTKDRVEGEMVDLMEIDPFSFFGLCLKYRKKDKRRAIFTKLKNYFELSVAIPSTYNGVPNSNPQQVWLFAYQHERKPQDIPLLWNLYKMAINKEISNQVFKKALEIKNVGTSKLTQSLFYLDPFTYLPINAQTIPYLEKRGVSCGFDSWEGYQKILQEVVAEIKRPFYEISYDAWLENRESQGQALAYLGSSKEIEKYVGSIQDKIEADEFCAIPWSHRFKDEMTYFHQHKPFRFYLYENDKKPLRYCYWVLDFTSNSSPIICPETWEKYLRTEAEKQTTNTGGYDRRTWMLVEKVEVLEEPIPFEQLTPHPRSSLEGGRLRSSVAVIQDPLGAISNSSAAEAVFKHNLKNFQRNDLEFFFEQCSRLLNRTSLTFGDQRITYAPYEDRLQISIGNRYCLLLDQRSKQTSWGFITSQKVNDPNITLDYDYKGGPTSYFYTSSVKESMGKHSNSIVMALSNEVERIGKSALLKHHNPCFEKAIFDLPYRVHILNETFGHKKHPQPMSSLNQILYGPPGTGKTYQTKALAVNILTGVEFEDRDNTNRRYYELFEEGRIKFVTFHQSTSYEDFVEGIKPIMEDEAEESGNLSYCIKEGIFKRMCVEAAYEYIKRERQGAAAAKALTFGQLYEELFNQFQEQLDKEKEIEIPLKSGHSVSVINLSVQGNFILQHKDGERSYTVSKNRLEKLYNEIDDIEAIPNIYTYFRSIIGGSNASAYWAILNQIMQLEQPSNGRMPAEHAVVQYEDKQRAFERINWQSIDTDQEVPAYVLIIDEINRGNIASILGELITLLEEDKRGGKREGLEVTLPYSKSKFSVPPNLYIIGTMNTADRSVEALDTALRRRFSFTEVAPDPSLLNEIVVEGIELETLLHTINKRIEKLLDKDHMIGHGDLIQLKEGENPLSRLKHVFQHKILPLLQEYFFGNLGKIELILGPAFVGVQYDEAFSFAKNATYEGEEYQDRPIYQIQDVESMDDNHFVEAVKAIYS